MPAPSPSPPPRSRPADPERPFPRRGSAVRRCRQPRAGAAPSPPREESPPPGHSSSSCWKGKYEAEPSARCAERSSEAAAAARASSGTERRRPSRSAAGPAACGPGALRSGGPGGCPCPRPRQPPAPVAAPAAVRSGRRGSGSGQGALRAAEMSAPFGGLLRYLFPALLLHGECGTARLPLKAAGVRGSPKNLSGGGGGARWVRSPSWPRALGPGWPGQVWQRMGSGQPPLALPEPRVSGTGLNHAESAPLPSVCHRRIVLQPGTAWMQLLVRAPHTKFLYSPPGESWRCRTPARLAETPYGAGAPPLPGKSYLPWRYYLRSLR